MLQNFDWANWRCGFLPPVSAMDEIELAHKFIHGGVGVGISMIRD